MKSKADIIRSIAASGLSVLDIGGTGYCEDNAYERELDEAWSGVAHRVTVDGHTSASIVCDLNKPLPDLPHMDIATCFDVLEHLLRPVDVLRAIPCPQIVVTLPNAASPITRHLERKFKATHVCAYTTHSATYALHLAGWRVTTVEYQFGKWSLAARVLNAVLSVWPPAFGTGIVIWAVRA